MHTYGYWSQSPRRLGRKPGKRLWSQAPSLSSAPIRTIFPPPLLHLSTSTCSQYQLAQYGRPSSLSLRSCVHLHTPAAHSSAKSSIVTHWLQ